MRKILSIAVLTILITSCRQQQNEDVMYDLAEVEAEMLPMTRQSQAEPHTPMDIVENQAVIKKKIIKDGRLGLRVTELERSKAAVDTLVNYHNGYYAHESFNNTDWESSYNLNIRIPSANFERFISAIEAGDGEILYKEINARDVTEQFIDLETRLENKNNYLKRYNELLKQANTVKEILEIEEKIRALEEEIESTTGRLKYLGDLVAYSTLDLTISKPKEFKYNPIIRDNFSERLKQSLSKGWYGLIDFLLFVVKIWPFWIVVAIFLFFWNKYKKPGKRK